MVKPPSAMSIELDYNEADTCRKFITPKLVAAGWEQPPHSITEQRHIVAYLDDLHARVAALKHLQSETAAELAALLPALLERVFREEL